MGILIYKTRHHQAWDGHIKQRGDEVQEDVYVYKIRVTELENKTEHFYEGPRIAGEVSLVRTVSFVKNKGLPF